MIIEYKCQNDNKFSTVSQELKQIKHFTNIKMKKKCSHHKYNSIRISMPLRSSESQKREKKINLSSLQIKKKNNEKQHNNKECWANKFQPFISPRRTKGNIKYFVQVIHKKIRAKSIQQNFKFSTIQLKQQNKSNKGFKGRKLSPYSLFHNNIHQKSKLYQYHIQTQQDNIPINQFTQEEQSDFNRFQDTQSSIEALKSKINRYRTKPQIKESSEVDPQIKKQIRSSPTANASLNMYRKKFKQVKDKNIKSQIDKDSKLFFDESVINKIQNITTKI